MTSGEVASKRRRGVVLTSEGQQRLQAAIAQIQEDEYDGQKLTIEELSGRTRLDPGTVSKVLDAEQGVDRRTLKSFFQTLDLELAENDYCKAEGSLGNGQSEGRLAVVPSNPQFSTVDLHLDWGEAPDVAIFYGRTDELDQLEQWIVGDRCRLIAVLGMGGMGKTSLTAKLIEHIVGGRNQGCAAASANSFPERRSTSEFEYVVWYSLRNAPTIEEALAYLIRFLQGQSGTALPKSLDSLISLFLQRLEQSRCLVVLDNTESILRGVERVGLYREGYAGYGELIRRVGEAPHQSCLILTSREKPREVGLLEGQARPVRSLQLSGLPLRDGVKILKTEGLSEGDEEQQQLLDRYSGNPLALKIAANAIHEYFGGDVASFFTDGATMFGDIRDLLDSQFERLATLDREVMYWLAINREPVTFAELMEEIVSPIKRPQLLEALESLLRRSLIERCQAGFTLQNVVMEYVTDRFVEQVSDELRDGRFELFHSHALLQTTIKDYVRRAQMQLILNPIAEQLIATNEQKAAWLQEWRNEPRFASGYAAGNLLNILCCSGEEVGQHDFSYLTIQHPYLQGARLKDVSFAHAHLVKPALTQPVAAILSVAFSPDGTLLATGDRQGEICLWHIADQQRVATYCGHKDWVRSVAFSPNGKYLASGSEDRTIRLWDVATGHCLRVLDESANGHRNWVFSVAFSPDGKTLASSSADHTVRLWQVESSEGMKVIGEHSECVFSVAFSPNGKMLASGGADCTVQLWDLEMDGCLDALQGHTRQVWAMTFSPDGKTLASVSADQTIRLWDVRTRQCLQVFQGHTDEVRSLAFHPNGQSFVTSSDDCTVRLWSVASSECAHVFQEHTDRVFSVAFSPDGALFASGSGDHTIRLWKVETLQCLHLFQGYTNHVGAVGFSLDGKILASGSEDGLVRLWDVETQHCVQVFQGHENRVWSVVFSPDGVSLASGSADRTVRLWNLETGQCTAILQGHRDEVCWVAFSPDGKTLASGSDDCTIRLWNAKTKQHQAVLQGHSEMVRSVAFSPKGKLLASCGADWEIRIWCTETYQCLAVLKGHTNRVRSVAFSPDGKVLASGGQDRTIRFWNMETFACVGHLEGHTNRVRAIAFSPDGKTLASGSNDQTIRLWDMATWQCRCVLNGHKNQIWAIAFASQESGKISDKVVLASGSVDGTIRLWNGWNGESLAVIPMPRPYEGVDITGVKITGITDLPDLLEVQKVSLKALGAVEYMR